jgi:hypothetical protein
MTGIDVGAGSWRGGTTIVAPHFRHRIFAPVGGMIASATA